jgi:ketosteroid isomerase-like protein
MDLEARTRDLFAAMEDVQVESILPFFAEDGRYEVRGVVEPMGKAAYERYLRTVKRRLPKVAFSLQEVVVKRNVVFAQWRAEGTLADGGDIRYAGLHVLSWDQDGRLTHATAYIEPEAVQAIAGHVASS